MTSRALLSIMCVLGMWIGAAAAPEAALGADVYDLFYDDATSATTNRLTLNIPQVHVIADMGDEDWATFNAESGLPYSIKVEQVGSGLDPELWVYPDGLGAPGVKTDFAGLGGGETFGRQSWPATGRFWLRVRAAALGTGPTSYTLTVTQNTGANNGLAVISGTKMALAGAIAGSLSLPETVGLMSGGAEITTAPLYTKAALAWPAGAFAGAPETALMIAGLGDPASDLATPMLDQWHRTFPLNLTVTRVGIGLDGQPFYPLQPLGLTIQMRGNAAQAELSDGLNAWPRAAYLDIPSGSRPDQAQVWRWSAAAGQWQVYDRAPAVTASGSDWLVQTRLTDMALTERSSDFFAAVASGQVTAAAAWALYQ